MKTTALVVLWFASQMAASKLGDGLPIWRVMAIEVAFGFGLLCWLEIVWTWR